MPETNSAPASFVDTIGAMRLLRLLVLAAALVGVALYLRQWYAERDRKLHEAEDTVKSALDDLDPIARMQVLKDVAKDVAGG